MSQDSTYSDLILSIPAQFHATSYKYGIHNMLQTAILYMYSQCTLQRSLKEIILDDNINRAEDVKREEMEYEARIEAQEYVKDDLFEITNLQDND